MSAVGPSPLSPSSSGSVLQPVTELERNSNVSCLCHLFSAFIIHDLQNRDSGLGQFANAQNILTSGSTIVSHARKLHKTGMIMLVVFTRSTTFTLSILVKGRQRALYLANQTPVRCLLDEEMCLISLGRFLFMVLIVN